MPKTQIGDLNIAYDVQGQGDPVLMLNGIGASRSGWGLQIPAVSAKYTAITLDNRDVGETGAGTNTAHYSTDQFARDMYEADSDFTVAERVAEAASRRGVTPAQIAIAWLLANPAVTAPTRSGRGIRGRRRRR